MELPPFEALVAGRPDKAALDYSPNLDTLIIPFAGVPRPGHLSGTIQIYTCIICTIMPARLQNLLSHFFSQHQRI